MTFRDSILIVGFILALFTVALYGTFGRTDQLVVLHADRGG